MEVKRQLDVLDRRLADNRFLAGDEYTIADMAVWPWYTISEQYVLILVNKEIIIVDFVMWKFIQYEMKPIVHR